MAYVYIAEASHPENTITNNSRYYIIINFIQIYCLVLDKRNKKADN